MYRTRLLALNYEFFSPNGVANHFVFFCYCSSSKIKNNDINFFVFSSECITFSTIWIEQWDQSIYYDTYENTGGCATSSLPESGASNSSVNKGKIITQ